MARAGAPRSGAPGRIKQAKRHLRTIMSKQHASLLPEEVRALKRVYDATKRSFSEQESPN